jgi:hypothetical protein
VLNQVRVVKAEAMLVVEAKAMTAYLQTLKQPVIDLLSKSL